MGSRHTRKQAQGDGPAGASRGPRGAGLGGAASRLQRRWPPGGDPAAVSAGVRQGSQAHSGVCRPILPPFQPKEKSLGEQRSPLTVAEVQVPGAAGRALGDAPLRLREATHWAAPRTPPGAQHMLSS